jgi:hypothetical protein
MAVFAHTTSLPKRYGKRIRGIFVSSGPALSTPIKFNLNFKKIFSGWFPILGLSNGINFGADLTWPDSNFKKGKLFHQLWSIYRYYQEIRKNWNRFTLSPTWNTHLAEQELPSW